MDNSRHVCWCLPRGRNKCRKVFFWQWTFAPQWAEHSCFSLRYLERLCNMHIGLSPRYVLPLYYHLYSSFFLSKTGNTYTIYFYNRYTRKEKAYFRQCTEFVINNLKSRYSFLTHRLENDGLCFSSWNVHNYCLIAERLRLLCCLFSLGSEWWVKSRREAIDFAQRRIPAYHLLKIYVRELRLNRLESGQLDMFVFRLFSPFF